MKGKLISKGCGSMNVIDRIKELNAKRGWTEYRLVKETGLPTSTVANIFHRDTVPSISTLETICAAFGISLSQFFAEGATISLTDEQQALLERWGMLTADQKKALLDLMEKMV